MKNKFKVGDVFSEQSFYKITKVGVNDYALEKDGKIVGISEQYLVENCLSADVFSKTEKVTASALSDVVTNNVMAVMSVCFRKKADNSEVAKTIVDQIIANSMSNNYSDHALRVENILNNAGDLRVMRGWHKGTYTPASRLIFNDMDVSDGNSRQVDLRTLEWVIYNDVKYVLK